MAVTGSAIGTLIVFVFSIIFVIFPVSFPIFLGRFGKRQVPVNLTTAPILAIAILWAAQCLGPSEIRLGIVGTDGVKPYNILILFFSLAYMAITLDITGILQAAAFWVSNKGGSSGWKLYIYFYILLTLVSVVVGNDPVILTGTVFLVYYTDVEGLNPVAWLIAEFAAANTASMVLFVGNPTNVVICEGFRVNNAAFTAYTILPFLACSVMCLGALAIQFRNPKHIARDLGESEDLDVRSVLNDPTGALVGSALLVTCLVVIIIVSFFRVDVWKISLPFAAAKFLFDLGWDQYRYRNGIQMVDDNMMVKQLRQHKAGHSHPKTLESGCMTEEPKPTIHYDHSSINGSPMKEVDAVNAIAGKQLGVPITDKNIRASSASSYLTAELAPDHYSDSPIHSTLNLPPPSLINSSSPGTRSNTDDSADSQTPLKEGALKNVMVTRTSVPSPVPKKPMEAEHPPISSFPALRRRYARFQRRFRANFPTLYTAFPRLPFALVPFAFSQFILIEALAHQGWIDIFARWLVIASGRQVFPTIWLVGVLGVVLCNISGTNIGATILLTKIVRASSMPDHTARAAAIALAVASNIGAVSFTFSASLAGLLWNQILVQKDIHIKQRMFAFWNLLPLLVMTVVGLGVVSAEMAVLYRGAM